MKDNNNLGFGNSLPFLVGFAWARRRRGKKAEMALKKEEIENRNKFGVADELKKLNDLLKEKIITQAEFDNQRKKLLR